MPAVVWFRRDLRLHDHPPLSEAAAEHEEIVPLFVLDPRLLQRSANRSRYLVDCLAALDASLDGRLVVRYGRPEEVVPRVAREAGASVVYAAGDVSPFARRRDARVAEHVRLQLRPGLFIGHLGSITSQAGSPYRVFGAFQRTWAGQPRRAVLPTPELRLGRLPSDELPEVAAPALVDRPEPGEAAALAALDRWVARGVERYPERRNLVGEHTSRMSQYLHFGCLSPLLLEQRTRHVTRYRSELAWRDFYAYALLHGVMPDPDRDWTGDDEAFAAWCEGRTGQPLVDAAMHQLVQSGWMHNRARMVVASYLINDLGVDWRRGEAFFLEHLIDGDIASNRGGWTWVAGNPRVFNPARQQQRFDTDGRYVNRWLPAGPRPRRAAPAADPLQLEIPRL